MAFEYSAAHPIHMHSQPVLCFFIGVILFVERNLPQMKLQKSHSCMQNVAVNIASVLAEIGSPFPRPANPPSYIDPAFSHKCHIFLAV